MSRIEAFHYRNGFDSNNAKRQWPKPNKHQTWIAFVHTTTVANQLTKKSPKLLADCNLLKQSAALPSQEFERLVFVSRASLAALFGEGGTWQKETRGAYSLQTQTNLHCKQRAHNNWNKTGATCNARKIHCNLIRKPSKEWNTTNKKPSIFRWSEWLWCSCLCMSKSCNMAFHAQITQNPVSKWGCNLRRCCCEGTCNIASFVVPNYPTFLVFTRFNVSCSQTIETNLCTHAWFPKPTLLFSCCCLLNHSPPWVWALGCGLSSNCKPSWCFWVVWVFGLLRITVCQRLQLVTQSDRTSSVWFTWLVYSFTRTTHSPDGFT